MLLIDNVKKALEEITQGNWKLGEGCIYVKSAYGEVNPICVRPNNDKDAQLITKAPIYLKAFLELVESLVADAEKEGDKHLKKCVDYENKIADLERNLEIADLVLKRYGHDPYLESVGYTEEALNFLKRIKYENETSFKLDEQGNDVPAPQKERIHFYMDKDGNLCRNERKTD